MADATTRLCSNRISRINRRASAARRLGSRARSDAQGSAAVPAASRGRTAIIRAAQLAHRFSVPSQTLSAAIVSMPTPVGLRAGADQRLAIPSDRVCCFGDTRSHGRPYAVVALGATNKILSTRPSEKFTLPSICVPPTVISGVASPVGATFGWPRIDLWRSPRARRTEPGHWLCEYRIALEKNAPQGGRTVGQADATSKLRSAGATGQASASQLVQPHADRLPI